MNIGIRAHDLCADNITDISKKVSELGFKCIQFALKKSIKDIPVCSGCFSPGLANFFKDELLKNNVRVSVLGCYINPVNPDKAELENALSSFEENLKFAKFLGAEMVGTEPGSIGDTAKNLSEENYEVFLASMKRLVNTAEKLGVFIGLEAVRTLTVDCPEKMKRFLDDINSPNVVVILDCSNMLRADNYKNQDEIIKKAFELYKDKIAAVHLKDFKFENGTLKRVLPGEGEFNFDLLFKLIKKHKPYVSMLLEEYKEEDIPKAKAALEEMFLKA